MDRKVRAAVALAAWAAWASTCLAANPHYQFSYGVSDPATGDVKQHSETRVGGAVRGSYSLLEPGGATRTVHYSADDIHGFTAVVQRDAQHQVSDAAASQHGGQQVLHGGQQVLHGGQQVLHGGQQVLHGGQQVLQGGQQVQHGLGAYVTAPNQQVLHVSASAKPQQPRSYAILATAPHQLAGYAQSRTYAPSLSISGYSGYPSYPGYSGYAVSPQPLVATPAVGGYETSHSGYAALPVAPQLAGYSATPYPLIPIQKLQARVNGFAAPGYAGYSAYSGYPGYYPGFSGYPGYSVSPHPVVSLQRPIPVFPTYEASVQKHGEYPVTVPVLKKPPAVQAEQTSVAATKHAASATASAKPELPLREASPAISIRKGGGGSLAAPAALAAPAPPELLAALLRGPAGYYAPAPPPGQHAWLLPHHPIQLHAE